MKNGSSILFDFNGLPRFRFQPPARTMSLPSQPVVPSDRPDFGNAQFPADTQACDGGKLIIFNDIVWKAICT